MTAKQEDFHEIKIELDQLQEIIFCIEVLNNPYDPYLSRNYARMLYKAKTHQIKFKKRANNSQLSHNHMYSIT